MSLKAKVEAIIYAAEEPITLEQISFLLKEIVLADLASARENAAIEQADSAVEAANAPAGEDALLPELAFQAAEGTSPEPGPLMPEPATPVDAEPSQIETENAVGAAFLQGGRSHEHGAPEPETEETPGSTPETAPDALAQGDDESSPADGQTIPATAGSDSAAPDSAEPGPAEPAPTEEPAPAGSAGVEAAETTSRKRQPKKTGEEIAEEKAVRARVREVLVELVTDYAHEDRGMEIRLVAGGFRMATKPEHHDVVRAFAKSLKPPIRLSLAALETLAVIAYKQPITAPEIADIRSVESASVLGTLLDRKLITTAGRKQVIGRPMQYKTSKDFLLRFGLNDVNELPSMEEFSQLTSDGAVEIEPSVPQDSLSLFEPAAQDTGAPEAAASTERASQSVPQSQEAELLSLGSKNVKSENVESKDVEPNGVEPENLELNEQGSRTSELPTSRRSRRGRQPGSRS